jgi:nicotinamidase-related amidase
MLLDADECQLVLVDYQARLMPALFDGAGALANGLRLAQAAELLGVPAWGTEQNPAKLGENDAALKALCRRTLAKMSFSAVDEGLGEWLRPQPPRLAPAAGGGGGGNVRSLPKHLRQRAEQQRAEQQRQTEEGRNTIVLGGCEAHVCLLQTALALVEDEFDVVVVTDACASRTERNRDAAFDRLAAAGAELVSTEMVLFEWLRSADHPDFKAVQALIK